MLEHMIDNLDIFICPACAGDLTIIGGSILCSRCQSSYRVENGIPLFYCPGTRDISKKDVTDVVKSFYEGTPFPNYEDSESVGDLIEKARQGVFARLLDEQIPYNIRILEVGCGTGQLSNFLGVAQRVVFGTDMCFNSLKLAQDFKNRCNLERVGFYQMNLFKPIFKTESFPLVICHGVLHHTSAPFEGLRSIGNLVQKGGYIIVGLYNKYGRIITDIRRVLMRKFGYRLKFFDYYLRREDTGEHIKKTWFMDQYMNPHESKHTFGEVLQWFSRTGFRFINSIPKLQPFEAFSKNERLFKENPTGSALDRFFVQTGLAFTGYKDGGLFLMIGKKIDYDS